MHQLVAIALLLGTFLVAPGHCDIPDDLIKMLPGWSGALPSPQYSGYIKLDPNSGKELHYWYITVRVYMNTIYYLSPI